MAAEFEKLAADFLDKLPEGHPDRPFLAGIHDVVTAYAERGSVERDSGTGREEPVETAFHAPDETNKPEPAATEQLASPEQDRVTLRGRLGKPPRFSDTPRGVRRAEFNLAVHEDDESTSWHSVLAFRQRAERLEAANPQKGQYAEVIGYRHVEERKDREGKPKTVERIVAAHIRLR